MWYSTCVQAENYELLKLHKMNHKNWRGSCVFKFCLVGDVTRLIFSLNRVYQIPSISPPSLKHVCFTCNYSVAVVREISCISFFTVLRRRGVFLYLRVVDLLAFLVARLHYSPALLIYVHQDLWLHSLYNFSLHFTLYPVHYGNKW